MSVESDHDESESLNATDYCSWWVVSTNYPSSGKVHIPAVVEAGGGDDPDTEPTAKTLCAIDRRRESTWQVKSHAILPPGFRDECGNCLDKLEEVLNDG